MFRSKIRLVSRQVKLALGPSIAFKICLNGGSVQLSSLTNQRHSYSSGLSGGTTNNGTPTATTQEEEQLDENVIADLLQEIDESNAPESREDDLQLGEISEESEMYPPEDTASIATGTPQRSTAGAAPESDQRLMESKPASELKVPELAYRPRVFLYGSVYHSSHPKEAAKHRKGGRKAKPLIDINGKPRAIIAPNRLEELCQWCYNILPAVPTDDLSDIQADTTTAAIPLVSNLYVVEDADCLWKVYEKKFKKTIKNRTSDEMQIFTKLLGNHNVAEAKELFSNIKNSKPGVTNLLKKLRDDLELFSKRQAALKKGREQSSSLPSTFLPLHSYPLTIVVSSSLSEKDAELLREEIQITVNKSKLLPPHLIHTVASEVQVWVLTHEETIRWRESLIDGDVGFSWPDHSVFSEAVSKEEGREVEQVQGRRTYQQWQAPPSRPRHTDPDVTVHEKDIASALKLIKKRKESSKAAPLVPPPEGLFPLQATVFPIVRTSELSDRAGMVLPPLANLFVIDTREAWASVNNSSSSSEEDGAIDEAVEKALKWHKADGAPLLFNTEMYRVTCDMSASEKQGRTTDSSSSASFPASVVRQQEEFSSARDAVMNKLWSKLRTRKAGSQEEGNSAANHGIKKNESLLGSTATTMVNQTGWKNESMLPVVFVLRTNLTPEKAVEVQRRLNRALLRADGNELNMVCVLSKQMSDGSVHLPPAAMEDHTTDTALSWAVEQNKERLFPLKLLLKKNENGIKSEPYELIQTRTLVEAKVKPDGDSSNPPINMSSSSGGSVHLASDSLGSPGFFIPYLFSLQSKPAPVKLTSTTGLDEQDEVVMPDASFGSAEDPVEEQNHSTDDDPVPAVEEEAPQEPEKTYY